MSRHSVRNRIHSLIISFFTAAGLFAAILAATALTSLTASAAGNRQCYLIGTSNVPVYSSSRLSGSVYGWIYPSDLIRVNQVTGSYCNVTYPAGSRMKTGYIRTSEILTATGGASWKANSKIYTYRRPGGASFGYLEPGDSVTIFGTKSGYTQVKYNVSSGYKYAWVKTSELDNARKKSSGNAQGKITVFSQTDSRWANVPYGKCNGKTAYLRRAGCGILSYVNAVYALNGRFIEPRTLANWSVQKGYRINGVGTAHALYSAFANAQGANYGFRYVKSASRVRDVRSNLQNGQVAIISVPSHLMALVRYNSSNGKYLVLDSYRSFSRGTAISGYRWLSESEFKGKMAVSAIMVLGKR